jgi:hypothetical protein
VPYWPHPVAIRLSKPCHVRVRTRVTIGFIGTVVGMRMV